MPEPKSTEGVNGRDIVVVGNRGPDYQKILEECIARHCPPNQDIAATLEVAQQHFEAGAYEAAYAALGASRRRNARFAKQYPVAVANLYHAAGVIAGHLGMPDQEWSSALDSVSAMKAGMPESDPRVFLERIELGDAYAKAGRFQDSEQQYSDVAGRARKLGLIGIEGLALLRVATLNTRLAEQVYTQYGGPARRAIAVVLSRQEPGFKPFVDVARKLQIQLAAVSAHGRDLDRLIEDFPVQPAGSTANLLYAPAITLDAVGAPGEESVGGSYNAGLPPMAMSNFVGQWIDVVFSIGTDGRVADVHIDRRGPHVIGKNDWTGKVIEAVAARRYARRAEPSRGRERYTFTANIEDVTGSGIKTRRTPRLVSTDLGPDAK